MATFQYDDERQDGASEHGDGPRPGGPVRREEFPVRWLEALNFTKYACEVLGVETDSTFALTLMAYLLPAPGENPYLPTEFILRLQGAYEQIEPLILSEIQRSRQPAHPSDRP